MYWTSYRCCFWLPCLVLHLVYFSWIFQSGLVKENTNQGLFFLSNMPFILTWLHFKFMEMRQHAPLQKNNTTLRDAKKLAVWSQHTWKVVQWNIASCSRKSNFDYRNKNLRAKVYLSFIHSFNWQTGLINNTGSLHVDVLIQSRLSFFIPIKQH